MSDQDRSQTVVTISANTEWRVVRDLFPDVTPQPSPYGEWFVAEIAVAGAIAPVRFFHSGWGKIAAAASTQYAIDRWAPTLLVNLGTCGGFAGRIDRGEIVLATRTVVYDIYDLMSDGDAELRHYSTDLDLSWLDDATTPAVRRATLVSADRDLVPGEIAQLHERFGAVAGDWESGAIAFVAARNQTRCLILRGVSDLVDQDGGDAYAGSLEVFVAGAKTVMTELVGALPTWLASVRS